MSQVTKAGGVPETLLKRKSPDDQWRLEVRLSTTTARVSDVLRQEEKFSCDTVTEPRRTRCLEEVNFRLIEIPFSNWHANVPDARHVEPVGSDQNSVPDSCPG